MNRIVTAVLAGLCLFGAQTALGQRGRARFLWPTLPRLSPGELIAPSVRLSNDSLRTIEFPAAVQVRERGQIVFAETLIVLLPPGDSADLWFGELECVDTLGVGYLLEFSVRDADTFERLAWIHCMTTTDTFCSYARARPPFIDGYLDVGEWDDAYRADISNLCGQSDSAVWPAGSAFALFKHDSAYLYVAVTIPPARAREFGDQIGLYIDEDNDGTWKPDSSEGNYWCLVSQSGGNEVQYRPWTPAGPGVPRAATGSECASGILNGFLVFECRFPFGDQPYELTVNSTASDTLGLFLHVADVDSGFSRMPGWWPMMLDDTLGWRTPFLYGKLILRTLQGGDIGIGGITGVPFDTTDTFTIWHPSVVLRNYGGSRVSGRLALVFSNASGIVRADTFDFDLYGGQSVQFRFPAIRFTTPGLHHGHLALVAHPDSIDWDFFVDPNLGVSEMSGRRPTAVAAPTILRGVLHLRPSPFPLSEGEGREDGAALLDAMGRKVLELQVGANDVRSLAPGVYFIRDASDTKPTTSKVLIAD